LGIAGGSLGLPGISFDLRHDAIFNASYNLDSRTAIRTEQIGNIYFDRVLLDAGSFLSTMVKPLTNVLGKVLGPVERVVGGGADAGSAFLNRRIPIISELFGDTTLAGLLGGDGA